MTLDIYFGAKVTGGNQNKANCRKIVDVLSKYGNILTMHLLLDDVESFEREYERQNPGDNAFLRDKRWLRQAMCGVFEVSEPSTGVGYEICDLINQGKPSLCLYHKDAKVSRFVIQNDSAYIESFSYEFGNMEEIFDRRIREFLRKWINRRL